MNKVMGELELEPRQAGIRAFGFTHYIMLPPTSRGLVYNKININIENMIRQIISYKEAEKSNL